VRRGLRTPPVARRVRAATIGAQRSSKHCGAVGGGALGRSVLVPITLLTVTQCQHCCRSARSPCVAALSRAIRYGPVLYTLPVCATHSAAQVCLRLMSGRGELRPCLLDHHVEHKQRVRMRDLPDLSAVLFDRVLRQPATATATATAARLDEVATGSSRTFRLLPVRSRSRIPRAIGKGG
jgi:hypothetical protein